MVLLAQNALGMFRFWLLLTLLSPVNLSVSHW
jgi:hypothetical protein